MHWQSPAQSTTQLAALALQVMVEPAPTLSEQMAWRAQVDCSTSGAPYSAKRRVNTRTALSAVGLATSSASTRLPWKSTTPTTHTGTDKRVADEAALLSLVLVEVHRSAAARRRAEVSVAVGRW